MHTHNRWIRVEDKVFQSTTDSFVYELVISTFGPNNSTGEFCAEQTVITGDASYPSHELAQIAAREHGGRFINFH